MWRAICETVAVNESRVQVMLHDLSRSCVDCVILSQKIINKVGLDCPNNLQVAYHTLDM